MVDALASGASVRMDVEVRVLSWAPITHITSLIFLKFFTARLGRTEVPLDL